MCNAKVRHAPIDYMLGSGCEIWRVSEGHGRKCVTRLTDGELGAPESGERGRSSFKTLCQ